VTTLNGKEPIYNSIIEILSINAFNNNILRWIDLRANDSVDKSTVENTNYCIVNIAENSPIDRMNVQERYLKDNFSNLSPRKGPCLLDSDVFYRFGLSIKRTAFRLAARDKASPGSFSSSICASPVLFAITMLAKICPPPDFISPGSRFFTNKMDHAITGGLFS
jgi:hypothetical protein